MYSGSAGANTRHPASTGANSRREHVFRTPIAEDARKIAELIASCPPLDANSLYCNLLQCTHFAGTCIVAERCGEIDGWISGYRPPDQPEAMFIWQVAVHERSRGQRLGVAMLEALLKRPGIRDASWLKTTVTPSNQASRHMFAAFARQRGSQVRTTPWFDKAQHFGGRHETEELISIGPL